MPKDTAKARENYERYSYHRDNGHLKYVQKAEKCEGYFSGEGHWDERLRRTLDRQGKPALVINKIIATMATVLGEQLENRADVSFQPGKDGVEDVAKALDKVYLNIAQNNKLDWLESEVFADGVITSRGFLDCRIDFNDNMQGEVRLAKLNPRNVVVDSEADEYDPDSWSEVFITKWMTNNHIGMLYNTADAKELGALTDAGDTFGYDSIDRPQNFAGGVDNPKFWDRDPRLSRRYRVIERQFKELNNVPHFVDKETGDTRIVPVNWDAKRIEQVAAAYDLGVIKRMVEQIRWVVTCDQFVLFDEISPYKHFTTIPFFPFFRYGKTIGLIENLLSSQDLLNKTASQELHILNTTSNSGWKVRAGALLNMDVEELEQRGAETGLVLELSDMDGIEKITPNQVPTGFDRVSYKADEAIKEISGISDSQRGMDRADVAAKAIRAKQMAGSVNLAKVMDNLAHTRHMVASRILDLVQTYYTEARVLNITGDGLGRRNEVIAVNQPQEDGSVLNDLTIGEYAVNVVTVPSRRDYAESQFNEAVQLREIGVAIPDDVLIKQTHLEDKAQIVERMMQANGGGEVDPMQQAVAELEVQKVQAEAQSIQADVAKKQSETELNMARAQKTLSDMQVEAMEVQQGGEDPQAKLMLQAQEMRASLQLQKEKQDGELQLAREKMQGELEIKRENARAEARIKRAREIMAMEKQEQTNAQRPQAEAPRNSSPAP